MLYIDENVIWNEVEGTITILTAPSGKYYELNGMGSMIWKLVAEGKNKKEIIEKLKNQFNAPEKKIALDVNIFIERLLGQKLLRE